MTRPFPLILLLILILPHPTLQAADGPALPYFTITVVDDVTGRGVPLVELTTTNHLRYVTDSNGIVAFYEQGLMNTDVFFHVKSHGYSYPKDGFGYAGLALKTTEGGRAEIKVHRDNIAQRLYRITGEGIYAESLLVGRPVPLKQPVINGLVLGQDSVLTAVYKNMVYWFWGDTNRPAYPLGNFHASGATSQLPGKGGLDPEVGIDLTYFVKEDGFSKDMMPFDAPGPVWLGGLLTLNDGTRGERLFAMYSNVDTAMKAQEIGIAEFDDKKEVFEKIEQFDLDTPIQPNGHPFRVTDKGVECIYFSPVTRVRADVASYKDPSKYEAFTALKEGSRKEKLEIDRDAQGKARFAWKKNTPALFPQDEARLIKEEKLKPEDALFHIQDVATGKPVAYHGASVSWNEYRKRFVMIMSEIFGTSLLGEVWYLEADTPLGPWVYARKIVTHDAYTFYNPRHHPMFDKDNGRVIYFDGTYTNWLTGHTNHTPRYDYNQIMYKLDLADPRLALPVPFYGLRTAGATGLVVKETIVGTIINQSGGRGKLTSVAFFAPNQPMEGCRPVVGAGGRLSLMPQEKSDAADQSGGGDRRLAFYALPADTPNPPPTTTPLYEYVSPSGSSFTYLTDPAWRQEGFVRAEKPLCLVWKNPMTVRLP